MKERGVLTNLIDAEMVIEARARRAAKRRGGVVGVEGKRLGKVVEAVVGVGRADRKRLSEEGHS